MLTPYKARVSSVLLVSLLLPLPVPSADPNSAAATTYRDPLLNADGTLNWTRWEAMARSFHTSGISYRLGPSFAELNPGANPIIPTIPQPDPQGLWRGGDAALAQAFCQTSDKLPTSDAQEKALYDEGGGWQMSGQLLFTPDANAPRDFQLGASNMRSFDGAQAVKYSPDRLNDRTGLCMRIRPGWYGDWWNRNNVSTPRTPVVDRLKAADPSLPLPAIATARGEIQSSVTGFLAFQNGVIAAAGTGNDAYCNGFATGTACEGSIKLPEGKIPTALALTAMNEFLFATVWDIKTRRGQLAVIAVGPDDPANIGPSGTGRYGWGAQSWPTIKGLKLLGFVDLPMAAPTSLSVSISTGSQKFRGFQTWTEDLRQQSIRDAWYQRQWDREGVDVQWRKMASAGYAIIASRAENRVSIVNLRPLLAYYRKMYLTTQFNFDQTANDRQGPAASQWPYTFDFAPEQKPVVLGSLAIPQPTAVYAPKRSEGTNSLSGWDGLDWNFRYRQAWVASFDGTVRVFDVTSIGDPTLTPVMPRTPKFTLRVGVNPVQITSPISSVTPNDEVFIVSRGTREIATFSYKGTPVSVLRDSRLIDPVFVTIGPDGAGYGGRGPGKAMGAKVLTVLDFNGKTVHDYGMYTPNYPAAYQPGRLDSWFVEQWPFLSPSGVLQPYQYGYGEVLPGKPFQFSFDEVI